MIKYRIIKYYLNGSPEEPTFYIQKKFLFWWRDIISAENGLKKFIRFKSFEAAKAYLLEKYMSGSGYVTESGETFTYERNKPYNI